MQVQVHPLSSTHNCSDFDCGSEPLNKWLAEMANQQGKKNIARTFVAIAVDKPANILGFYTLAVSEVSRDGFPNSKKFPHRVPVVRLGRFATHKAVQRMGIGEMLMFNAFERIAELSNGAGIAAIAVDAKDSKAAAYYARFGFIPSPDNALQLFLLISTLKEAIAKSCG